MDPTTQQGIGYAVVALSGAAFSKVIGFFDERDKRRHDLRLSQLETKVDSCEAQHQECRDQHEETTKELETNRKEKHDLRNELHAVKLTVERIRRRAEKHHGTEDDTAERAPLPSNLPPPKSDK